MSCHARYTPTWVESWYRSTTKITYNKWPIYTHIKPHTKFQTNLFSGSQAFCNKVTHFCKILECKISAVEKFKSKKSTKYVRVYVCSIVEKVRGCMVAQWLTTNKINMRNVKYVRAYCCAVNNTFDFWYIITCTKVHYS